MILAVLGLLLPHPLSLLEMKLVLELRSFQIALEDGVQLGNMKLNVQHCGYAQELNAIVDDQHMIVQLF